MDEYEDIDTYNGDAAHDMNVDFDRYMNTGDGAELFDETDLDEYIDNLNDWD